MQTNSPQEDSTRDLVRQLAQDAGRASPRRWSFTLILGLGVGVSLVAALLIVGLVFGVRNDLPSLPFKGIFQFKVAAMLLLVLGALCLVRAAGTPGKRLRPMLAVAPTIMLLLIGIWIDSSRFPVSGARSISIPVCLGAIVLAAMPGLAVLLTALRCGIPTRLSAAGAAAGLLSGALGALAYTIACINDGALFVALWYPAAILVTTAIGAVLGSRMLKWS